MSTEYLAALGIFITGLLTTAFGLYQSFRKNKSDENAKLIAELYRMMAERKVAHDADMDDLRQRYHDDLELVKAGQKACLDRELISNALANRQDIEITRLTAQVKSLTDRLEASGIDRRSGS